MPSRKKNIPKASQALPWLKEHGELDLAIGKVVDAFYKDRLQPEIPDISVQQEANLTREFHKAEQARSPAGVFMRSFAKTAGIDEISMVHIGSMKSRERAMIKLSDPSRNLKDLGRGRIYLNNTKDYRAALKLLRGIKTDGTINGVNCRSAKICTYANGLTYLNYLELPRRSGYMGSINLDLDVDLGKNRHGYFEVQIMPREYAETYEKSHMLYELIRKIEPIPSAMRSFEQSSVLFALCTANEMLFREDAARTGFDSVAKEPLKLPDYSTVQRLIAILDKIRDAAEYHPQRKDLEEMPDEHDSQVAQRLMEAITYAKSSLANIYFSQNAEPTLDKL